MGFLRLKKFVILLFGGESGRQKMNGKIAKTGFIKNKTECINKSHYEEGLNQYSTLTGMPGELF